MLQYVKELHSSAIRGPLLMKYIFCMLFVLQSVCSNLNVFNNLNQYLKAKSKNKTKINIILPFSCVTLIVVQSIMIEIVLARLLNYGSNQYTNNIIIPTLFIKKNVGDIAIASVRPSVCPSVRHAFAS